MKGYLPLVQYLYTSRGGRARKRKLLQTPMAGRRSSATDIERGGLPHTKPRSRAIAGMGRYARGTRVVISLRDARVYGDEGYAPRHKFGEDKGSRARSAFIIRERRKCERILPGTILATEGRRLANWSRRRP